MPTAISGAELGLLNANAHGVSGQGSVGQAGSNVYVNTATGNLVLQQQDQLLVGEGIDNFIVRTYNSQGHFNDDNGDNFRFSFNQRLTSLFGDANTVGSSITRIAGDGSESIFSYDNLQGVYVSADGEGAHDNLSYNETIGEWTYTEGSSRLQETYDWNNGEGKLIARSDVDGNTTTYGYHANGFIDQITDVSGQVLTIQYSGTNVTQVTTTSDGQHSTLVYYSYDALNRLTSVSIDLTPEDQDIVDGNVYTTIYTYDGDSKRLASLSQSDGTTTSFTYDTSGRVATVTDGENSTITYSYVAGSSQISETYDRQDSSLSFETTYVSDMPFVVLSNGWGPAETDLSNGETAAGDGNPLTLNGQVFSKGLGVHANSEVQVALNGNYARFQAVIGIDDEMGSYGNVIFQVVADGGVIYESGSMTGSSTSEVLDIDVSGHDDLRLIVLTNGSASQDHADWADARLEASVPHYEVATGETWESLGQVLYGTEDVASQLQGALSGIYNLSAGEQILQSDLPVSLQVESSGTTATETTVTDALGNVTSYTYDAEGSATQILSPTINGSRLSTDYTYDADGNVLSVTNSDGETTAYTYDANGNELSRQDATGNRVESTYNSFNQLATQTVFLTPDPDGTGAATASDPETTHYIYDSEQHVRFVVSDGGQVIENRYDAEGNAITAIQYVASAYIGTDFSESALSAWAASQDQTSIKRVDTSYDFRGQVDSVITYSSTGSNGLGVVDGSESTTQFIYDQNGRLLETIAPNGVATATVGDYRTSFSYDGLGRLLTATDALGRITVTSYDDVGQKIVTTSANGLISTSTYDDSGRLISQTQSDSANALGTATFEYNKEGQLIKSTDPLARSTYNFYDNLGRPQAQIDAQGYLLVTAYDQAGREGAVTAYSQALTASQINDLYSAAQTGSIESVLATVVTAVSGVGDRIAYNIYNDGGQLIYQVDAAGNLTQLFYDGAGRITDTVEYSTSINTSSLTVDSEASSITPVTTSEDRHSRLFYDNNGQAVGGLDAQGYLTESRFDQAGQLIETIAFNNAADSTLWASGSFDQLKASISTSSYDQHNHQFYDGKGQLIASLNAENFLTEYQYDVSGNLTEQTSYTTAGVNYTGTQTVSQLRPASSSNDQVVLSTYTHLDQVETVTERAGATVTTQTSFSYDEVGNVTETVRGLATNELRANRVRYDIQNRLVGELTAEGSAALDALVNPTQAEVDAIWVQYGVTHTYDSSGQLISTTDQNNNTTLFYYNDRSELTHIVSADGSVVQTQYSAFGQVVDTISYNNRISTTGLTGGQVGTDLTNRLAAARDLLNDNHIQTTYTELGSIAEVLDAEGFALTQSYNAFNELVQSEQAIGVSQSLISTYTYDQRGLLTAITDDTAGVQRQASTTYDAFGRALTTTDGNGVQNQFAYDRLGRVVQTTAANNGVNSIANLATYDAFDRVLTQTDGNGQVTQYQYNDADRTVTITTPEGVLTQVKTNEHSEQIEITDGNGVVIQFAYDLNGNQVTTTRALGTTEQTVETAGYDKANLLIATTDALGTVTQLTYDAANRLLQRVVDPTGLNIATSFAYDGQGRTIQTTDPLGVIAESQFDKKGQLTATISDVGGENIRTEYTYDGQGNALTVIQAAGTSDARTLQYQYDNLSRLTQEIKDPGGLNITTAYSYDDNDNLVQSTDPNGVATTYVYDEHNRQTQTTIDPAGFNIITSSNYDDNGNVVTQTDPNGTVTQYTYDDDNRVVQAAIDPSGLNITTSTAYDANGNVVSQTDPNGTVTVYTHDALNRVTQTTQDPAGLSVITSTNYDANGNIISSVNGNGTITAYQYDALNRITEKREDASGLNIKSSSTYDANNNIVYTIQAEGFAESRETRYIYDDANRLIFVVDALGGVTETNYDDAGNAQSTRQYNTRIALNGLSAQATASEITSLLASSSLDRISYQQYDGVNRITHSVDSYGGIVGWNYDAAGNQLQQTAYEQQLSSAQLNDLSNNNLDVASVTVSGSNDRVARNVYDAVNRSVYAIDALGYVKETQYDSSGNTLREISYANVVTVSSTPTLSEMATALAGIKTDTLNYQTSLSVDNSQETFFRDPVQPYTYLEQAESIISGSLPFDTNLIINNEVNDVLVSPIQPHGLLTSAIAGNINTVQETLAVTVSNSVITQSSNVQNYAYTRSGTSLVTTSGVSLSSGTAPYNDTSPTQVKATIYRSDGSYYDTEYVNVGYYQNGYWDNNDTYFVQTGYGENGPEGYWANTGGHFQTSSSSSNGSAQLWHKVSNWNGKVNLSVGSSMPDDTYRVEIEVRDDAKVSGTGKIDLTDGKWVRTSTVYATVGNPVSPTTLSWSSSLQPVGSTASFSYRSVGDTNYTDLTVTESGGTQSVDMGVVAAGDYEYILEYKDSYGRVLKSVQDTINVPSGGTNTYDDILVSETVSSDSVFGLSIDNYLTVSEQASVEKVVTTVKNASDSSIVGTATTYTETSGYDGDVNLIIGGELPPGQYNIDLVLHNKNGTTESRSIYYEIGEQTHAQQNTDLTWSAENQQTGSYAKLLYRAVGESTYTEVTPVLSTGNYSVSVTDLADGNYEYLIQYLSNENDVVLQEGAGQFTVVDIGNTSQTVTIDPQNLIEQIVEPVTLSLSNTSSHQSSNVNNYAWVRSGDSLTTTTGVSLAIGTAPFIDNTPTQVKATIYRSDGSYHDTEYVDVGYYQHGYWVSAYTVYDENGDINYPAKFVTDITTEDGSPPGVPAQKWFAVNNWNGQVNLRLGGNMPADTYRIVIETRDDAKVDGGGKIDETDGTWVQSSTVYATVGDHVQPTTLSWPDATMPANTTATVSYRTVGGSGYSEVSGSHSGNTISANLGNLNSGNYEYIIKYEDDFGRVLKSAEGTFTVGFGATTTAQTDMVSELINTASVAGSSISNYLSTEEQNIVKTIEATVRDSVSNGVVSEATTYTTAGGYSGDVNLKIGGTLPGGSYTVDLVLNYHDDTTELRTLSYEVGMQAYQDQRTVFNWTDDSQPENTTVDFQYAALGSAVYTQSQVTSNGSQHSVQVDHLDEGTYNYVATYRNDLGVEVISASGSFDVNLTGSGTGILHFTPGINNADRDTSYSYDAVGRLITTTDSLGSVESYSYDAVGNRMSVVDMLGNTTSLAYDSLGRVTSSTDALGNAEAFTYDAVGNQTSVTNKLGNTWDYQYDALNRLVSETTPLVDVARLQEVNGVTSIVTADGTTLPEERITTTMTYDAFGNLAARTEASGTIDARTTTYQYDLLGQQVGVIYPEVGVYDTHAAADVDGRTETVISPTSQTVYDRFGQAVSNKDVSGAYSYKIYDSLGRIAYEIDAERYVTAHNYDHFGNKTSYTRYANSLDENLFDVRETGSNPVFTEEELALELQMLASENDRTIRNSYNQLNQLVRAEQSQVYNYDSRSETGYLASPTTDNVYNAFGEVIRQSVSTNQNATQFAHTTFYYNELGQRIAEVDAEGYVSTFEYDDNGNLTNKTEYALATNEWGSQSFTLPTATRIETSPNSTVGYDRITNYSYDALGQQVTETKFGVQASELTTSGSLGVTTSKIDIVTTTQYDALGNVISVENPDGITRTYYDVLGRSVAVAQPVRADGASTVTPITEYQRDVFGNITHLTNYANGAEYTSDNSYILGATSSDDQHNYVAYNSFGEATLVVDAEGGEARLSYDANGNNLRTWQTFTDIDGREQVRVELFDYDRLGQEVASHIYGEGGSSVSATSVSVLSEASNANWITSKYSVTYINDNTTEDGELTEVIQLTPDTTYSNGNLYYNGQRITQTTENYSGEEDNIRLASVTGKHWTGTNTVTLDWDSLESLGTGNVRVTLNYLGSNGAGRSGVTQYQSEEYSAVSSNTGVTVHWTPGLNSGGSAFNTLEKVTRVVVEKFIDGEWIVVNDESVSIKTNDSEYNAFGEVVSKGLNGGEQEYFNYDNAGRLVSSNQDDGVNKGYLYDLQGNNTALVKSVDVDLSESAYKDGATIAALDPSNIVRTDIKYDLLGRAIQEQSPVAAGGSIPISANLQSGLVSVSTGNTQSAIYRTETIRFVTEYTEDVALETKVFTADGRLVNADPADPFIYKRGPVTYTDEDGSHTVTGWVRDLDIANIVGNKIYYWDRKQHTAELDWSSLSAWGKGNVRTTIDYTLANTSGSTITGSHTQTYSHSSSVNGVTLHWDVNGTSTNAYNLIQSINAIHVEKFIDGQWQTLHDINSSSDTEKVLSWNESDLPGNVVTLEYRQVGETDWQTAAVSTKANRYWANFDGVANGTYEYQISYLRPNESEAYATATGTFSLGNSVVSKGISFSPEENAQRPVVNQTHDRWGNVISRSDARDSNILTEYRYNYANQRISEIKPETDVWDESGNLTRARPTTHTHYDASGRAVANVDANGNLTGRGYDASGQLVTEHNADSSTVLYSYDLLGNTTEKTDGNGNTVSYVYDKNGFLLEEQRPLSTNSYTYDEFGRRITHTNGENEVVKYIYDIFDNVIETRLPQWTTSEDYSIKSRYDISGNKILEEYANGDFQEWTYDYFGQKQTAIDLGAATYNYSYDLLGNRVAESNSRGQNIIYDYYDNGLLKQINDIAKNTQTLYEYDVNNKIVREQYIENGAIYQNTAILYDELGRTSQISDDGYDLTYYYDANGNRRRTYSEYLDTNGTLKTQNYWYKYDSSDRIVLAQGVLSGGQIQINSSQGSQLAYDANGNRASSTSYESGSLATDTYVFDAQNRLTSTLRSGVLTSLRTYDDADRNIEYKSYKSSGALDERRVSIYNDNGNLTRQDTYDGSRLSARVYYYYDLAGNTTQYSQTQYADPADDDSITFTNTYTYTYAKFDSYRESRVDGTSTYFEDGYTTSTYDVNGNRVQVYDARAETNRTRNFIVNNAGQILRKTEGGEHQYYYYANSIGVGTAGALSEADFDYNYTPVSEINPSSTPGNYIVNSGDTLQTIALAVYGDAKLWYLIADANNVSTSADLSVGQSLKIPSGITNIHNSSDTFKPYNPGEIIGSTDPTLPDPPPKKSGGGCAQIIVIIVAIVVTVITAGAAAAALGPALGAYAGVAGAVVGAVAGSVASQIVGIALGVQEGFDWGAVALAAVTAAIPGVGAAASKAANLTGTAAQILTNVVNNALGQAVNIAAGKQDKFNWGSVALAGVSAPLTSSINKSFGLAADGTSGAAGNPFSLKEFGNKFAANLVTGSVNEGLSIVVGQKGKFDFASVATNAFGDAIGNSIKDQQNYDKTRLSAISAINAEYDSKNDGDIEGQKNLSRLNAISSINAEYDSKNDGDIEGQENYARLNAISSINAEYSSKNDGDIEGQKNYARLNAISSINAEYNAKNAGDIEAQKRLATSGRVPGLEGSHGIISQNNAPVAENDRDRKVISGPSTKTANSFIAKNGVPLNDTKTGRFNNPFSKKSALRTQKENQKPDLGLDIKLNLFKFGSDENKTLGEFKGNQSEFFDGALVIGPEGRSVLTNTGSGNITKNGFEIKAEKAIKGDIVYAQARKEGRLGTIDATFSTIAEAGAGLDVKAFYDKSSASLVDVKIAAKAGGVASLFTGTVTAQSEEFSIDPFGIFNVKVGGTAQGHLVAAGASIEGGFQTLKSKPGFKAFAGVGVSPFAGGKVKGTIEFSINTDAVKTFFDKF